MEIVILITIKGTQSNTYIYIYIYIYKIEKNIFVNKVIIYNNKT